MRLSSIEERMATLENRVARIAVAVIAIRHTVQRSDTIDAGEE